MFVKAYGTLKLYVMEIENFSSVASISLCLKRAVMISLMHSIKAKLQCKSSKRTP